MYAAAYAALFASLLPIIELGTKFFFDFLFGSTTQNLIGSIILKEKRGFMANSELIS